MTHLLGKASVTGPVQRCPKAVKDESKISENIPKHSSTARHSLLSVICVGCVLRRQIGSIFSHIRLILSLGNVLVPYFFVLWGNTDAVIIY